MGGRAYVCLGEDLGLALCTHPCRNATCNLHFIVTSRHNQNGRLLFLSYYHLRCHLGVSRRRCDTFKYVSFISALYSQLNTSGNVEGRSKERSPVIQDINSSRQIDLVFFSVPVKFALKTDLSHHLMILMTFWSESPTLAYVAVM